MQCCQSERTEKTITSAIPLGFRSPSSSDILTKSSDTWRASLRTSCTHTSGFQSCCPNAASTQEHMLWKSQSCFPAVSNLCSHPLGGVLQAAQGAMCYSGSALTSMPAGLPTLTWSASMSEAAPEPVLEGLRRPGSPATESGGVLEDLQGQQDNQCSHLSECSRVPVEHW